MTNSIYIHDPHLPISLSVDPLTEQTMTPYQYTYQNPVRYIDPTGMAAEPPGDYYTKKGVWLGSDGKNDNKVYTADSMSEIENKNGSISTVFNNAEELPISHSEFRKQSATVYAESSAYKMNTVTDDLEKEMFAIASVHQRNDIAFGADAPKAKEYLSLSPEKINNSKFKTTANAAVINAVTGGFDYSYGATMWDGAEQGLFPASDNRRSTGKFELHMNTMGWNISDKHYNTWKSNVGKNFVAPQQKAAPDNFGNYRNKGKMRLHSTAVYGETIFWKVK